MTRKQDTEGGSHLHPEPLNPWLHEVPLPGAHQGEFNRRFSVYSQALHSGTLGCNPSSITVCLAHQANSVQCIENNYENVLGYFEFNMSNCYLSPGKWLLADRHKTQCFNAKGQVK